MDEWLLEVAKEALKPSEWQILIWIVAQRNTTTHVSLTHLKRSQDAKWKATRSLMRLGYIEQVPESHFWRVTAKLRERLDGKQPDVLPSALPPAEPPQAVAAGPEPESFSAEPQSSPPRSVSTVPPPSQALTATPPTGRLSGFLGLDEETQLAALRLWRNARVRLDLLQLVIARRQDAAFVHPDLDDALKTAARWAATLA